MRCVECGSEAAGATQYCKDCGAPVPGRQSARTELSLAGHIPQVSAPRQRIGREVRILALVSLGVVVLGTIAVVALVAAVRSATASAPRSAVQPKVSKSSSELLLTDQELRAGDCLRGSDLGLGTGSTWPDYFTVVPCTERHVAEVFYSGNPWPASRVAYPGDTAVNNKSDSICETAFENYTAPEYAPEFTYDEVTPDYSSWWSGDKSLQCVAYNGLQVNYSIKKRVR